MAKKKQCKTDAAAGSPSITNYPEHSTGRAVKPWQWLLLFFLVYFLCDLLRLMDGPSRLAGYEFNGVPLMQNSDSYAWLAAAKKINQFSGKFLPEILRLGNILTGIDIGTFGFYLPLVLAPLVIVPVFLLATWWRMHEAALSAALMTGASFGFLSRTLSGWLDTDVLTLFFPVSIAVALLVWLEYFFYSSDTGGPPVRRQIFVGAFAIGVLFRSYLLFYPNGEIIGLSIIGVALLAGLAKSRKDLRCDLSICIVIILLVGNGSSAGFGSAACAAGLILIKPDFFASKNVRIAGVFLAIALFFSCYSFASFSNNWMKIMNYGKLAPGSGPLNLPSVIKTVEEAQTTGIETVIRSVAGSWLLLSAGMIGFIYCVLKRPAALVFSPLLLLGLSCGTLGARFGMYGGAVLGIGLGFGLALILRSFGAKTYVRWIFQAVMAAVVFWTTRDLVRTTDLTDWHITREYADSFKELKKISAADAQIWTWWDWGYAAQYFSERRTFADGGRNSASYVLPLARIHYTSSPLYAYQCMLFTAEQQKKAGNELKSNGSVPLYANPYNALFTKQDPKEVRDLMDGFSSKLQFSRGDVPEQYLVVTWENLNYVPVIRSFGSWNVITGESLKGTFATGGNLRVDIRSGVISHGGRQYELAAMDMVGQQSGTLERQHNAWPGRKQDYFGVANSMDGSFYPMDEASYHSLMVQMLISEPERFEPYFKLVIDRAPHIRIYRLNVNQS
jgi:dolichyl-diphosphooligosaccharide--protein glycosyltransferase